MRYSKCEVGDPEYSDGFPARIVTVAPEFGKLETVTATIGLIS